MGTPLKVYRTAEFIKQSANGKVDLERSLLTVRQLAAAAEFHRDHNILLDLRDAVLDDDHSEVIRVAAEFAVYHQSFRNKIAVLVPDTAERIARAAFMKSCMDLKGFQWEFFLSYEEAIDWFSEVTEISLNNI